MAKSSPKPTPVTPAPAPEPRRDAGGYPIPSDLLQEPVRLTYFQALRVTSVVETARTLRSLIAQMPPEAGGAPASYPTRSHRNDLPEPLAAALLRLRAELEAVLDLAGPGPGNK